MILDARDGKKYAEQVEKFKPDTIYHLAGLLSATAEKKPQLAWDININGICNALECGRIYHSAVFFPSSIAAFGPDTALLVKASHAMHMETIVKELEAQT